MNDKPAPSRAIRSPRRLVPAALGIAAIVLAAAACSSSSSSGSSSGGSSGSGTTTATNSGVTHAKAAVTKAEAESTYPVPTTTLSGVSALKGKTVYYVPITQQAPQFATTAAGLKQALSAAGVSLQVCNGNSNPSQVSACISQATGAKAGAIITDSIPYGLAANALSAAQAKGIPVIITDQVADPTHPASKTLAYLYDPGATQLAEVADWIIADSAGKAKVLINESTDSPSTIAYVAAAQKEFKTYCSGCTVVINKISSANFSLIASSTSSALLSNPGIGYVVPEFEQYLQPTTGGIQQSGKKASIKVVTSAAQIDSLQELKAKQLAAAAGQSSGYQGWVDADAALRLMLKQPVAVPATTVPTRLFTSNNIDSLSLTDAAQTSGAWYGSTSYQQAFQKQWGV
jgi:ribose transport system substrate-binding protein